MSGYLYGLVMELWFWPFLTDGSALAWDPGGGAWTNVRHYLALLRGRRLAWDTFRAVGNVVLVVAIGRPLLAALDRAARRMQLRRGMTGRQPTTGGDRMGQFPPSFFQDPTRSSNRRWNAMLEEEEQEQHGDHEHGPGCGHEAVEHDDHVDYLPRDTGTS